jgi:GDP-4-dehydro-6-deoxy-D-mannose reductase
VKQVAPELVMNFASITTVRESFADPRQTYQIGFGGTLNLLLALKENSFAGSMLNISSSEVYGFPRDEELPVSELTPLRPMSPYAVSKVATEALCYQWSQTERFRIVTARAFTHIGPGQSDRFAISNFARQVAQISLGRSEPVIRVGSLDTTRDLTDVRDVVCAYRLLLEQGRTSEVYNVCSNKETNIRSLLNQLIESAGVSVDIEHDETLLRAAEQRRTLGSHAKIHNEIGWTPSIPPSRTIGDMLSYWVNRLK